jgi:hypothetical protein
MPCGGVKVPDLARDTDQVGVIQLHRDIVFVGLGENGVMARSQCAIRYASPRSEMSSEQRHVAQEIAPRIPQRHSGISAQHRRS